MSTGDLRQRARVALQPLVTRRFEDWRGVVPGTTVDDVAAMLDVDRSWTGGGALGSERRPAGWLAAGAAGYADGLRVWIVDDHVVLIDAREVELAGSVPSLLAALGAPAATLDSYLGVLEIPRSELVFPDRGLTVYVNPENRALLRLAVYAPTTLDAYVRGLRLDLQQVRLPRRIAHAVTR